MFTSVINNYEKKQIKGTRKNIFRTYFLHKLNFLLYISRCIRPMNALSSTDPEKLIKSCT